MMVEFLRRILFVHMAITRADAVAIAERECTGRGWPWTAPIRVEEGVYVYWIRTNVGMRGGNVNICVDGRSGTVVKAGFAAY